MKKMEKDVVILLKPKFSCRYVNGTYKRKNENQPDELFKRMKKYHPNISLTVEVNPFIFLGKKVSRDTNEIKGSAYQKENSIR